MFFDRFKKYKYDNTRRYLRLPAAWPIKCEPLPTDDKRPFLTTKDVSAGGVAVVVPAMLPIGKMLRVSIQVPPLNRSVEAAAEVVRCTPVTGGFELGLRFTNIDLKDQQELDKAIEKFHSPGARARQQQSWWRKIA